VFTIFDDCHILCKNSGFLENQSYEHFVLKKMAVSGVKIGAPSPLFFGKK
jgi:hypothetical protein